MFILEILSRIDTVLLQHVQIIGHRQRGDPNTNLVLPMGTLTCMVISVGRFSITVRVMPVTLTSIRIIVIRSILVTSRFA